MCFSPVIIFAAFCSKFELVKLFSSFEENDWYMLWYNPLIIMIIHILLDLLLTVEAATLIFISGCGLAIPSAMEGKSGFIYNLVKSK